MEMLCTGVPVDAQRAYELGLLNAVVPKGQELSVAVEQARLLASRPATALAAAKSLVIASLEVPAAIGDELEALWNLRCISQPEFSERVREYLSRRQSRRQSTPS